MWQHFACYGTYSHIIEPIGIFSFALTPHPKRTTRDSLFEVREALDNFETFWKRSEKLESVPASIHN